MNTLEIPVSDCANCGLVPVVVLTFNDEDKGIMDGITVVYCALCESYLNEGDKDIKVEWYTPEELEKLGFQVKQETESVEE